MKLLIITKPYIYLIMVCLFSWNSPGFLFGQSKSKYINPTGTYELGSKTQEKDGETYGYFGEIQVKLLSHNKVAMTFYICKGAPSYNSGDFVDTLFYDNNKLVYADKDTTTKCITTFKFTATGVTVSENPKAKQTCWGHGVVAFGRFTKKSSKIPILTDHCQEKSYEI